MFSDIFLSYPLLSLPRLRQSKYNYESEFYNMVSTLEKQCNHQYINEENFSMIDAFNFSASCLLVQYLSWYNLLPILIGIFSRRNFFGYYLVCS